MIVRKAMKNPDSLLKSGMLFLILFNTTNYVLRRHFAVNEDVTDFASGALLGIAMSLLLLSIWIRGRAGRLPRE